MRRREDLSTPRRRRRRDLGIHYDPDAFGQFSEAIARTLGTARFLVIQTAIVILWITLNVVGDTAFEPNETFTIGLSNATGATITDNSGAGTIPGERRHRQTDVR